MIETKNLSRILNNPEAVDNLSAKEEVRYDNRGHRLCNARNNTCTRWAMVSVGSNKCDRDGGKTPRGIASPHFKTGRHSKYLGSLPDALKDGYIAARKRKDLLTNSDEIALLDARLEQVLKQVSFGEEETVWASLRAVWDRFEGAMKDQNIEGAIATVPEIARLIKQGGADWMIWGEISKLLEQRRKFVESESKRLLQAQETLTSSEAFLLFNALISVVQEHVPDREQRAKIQTGFTRIVQGAGRVQRIAG